MAASTAASRTHSYRFKDVPVRVTFIGEDPWFFAFDLLDALELDRSNFHVLPWPKGAADVGGNEPLINEIGVNTMLLAKASPASVELRRWLATDVFPTLYRDAYIERLRVMLSDSRALAGADGKRQKFRHLSAEEKAEILRLKNAGWTIQGLARRFRRGDTTIRAVLKGGW